MILLSSLQAQAMVMVEYGKPLELQDVNVELPSDAIVVEILAAGVCGSDLHMWRGKDPRAVPPFVLGHEGVGRIFSLPHEKQDLLGSELKNGDLVLWNRGMSCGECEHCVLWKRPALCQKRWTYGINPPRDWGLLQGCYATHILLRPQTEFVKLSAEVDLEAMVTASCSGATAAHALDLVSIRPGQTVLVQGSGPMGLFAVALAANRGARVFVIGSGRERLRLAIQLGAHRVWDRRQTSIQARSEEIKAGGSGVDVVVEAVGRSSALEEGLALLRPGGTYLVAGFGNPQDQLQLDPFQLARRQIRLQGVWTGDATHLLHAASLVASGPARFKNMATTFPLKAANEALLAMERREIIKAVLKP